MLSLPAAASLSGLLFLYDLPEQHIPAPQGHGPHAAQKQEPCKGGYVPFLPFLRCRGGRLRSGGRRRWLGREARQHLNFNLGRLPDRGGGLRLFRGARRLRRSGLRHQVNGRRRGKRFLCGRRRGGLFLPGRFRRLWGGRNRGRSCRRRRLGGPLGSPFRCLRRGRCRNRCGCYHRRRRRRYRRDLCRGLRRCFWRAPGRGRRCCFWRNTGRSFRRRLGGSLRCGLCCDRG